MNLPFDDCAKVDALALPALHTAAQQLIDVRDSFAEALRGLAPPQGINDALAKLTFKIGDPRRSDDAFNDVIRARQASLKLQGCFLAGARLHGAHLQGAILFRCRLQGVKLIMARLQGADLSEAQMQGAYLTDASARGGCLIRAMLHGADLTRIDMHRAILIMAELENANLRGAQLQGADLGGARLEGTNLMQTNLEGTMLFGAFVDTLGIFGRRKTIFPRDALKSIDFEPTSAYTSNNDAVQRTKEVIAYLQKIKVEAEAGEEAADCYSENFNQAESFEHDE